LVGSGIGDAAAIVAGGRQLDSGKPRRIDPYTVVRGMGSAPAAALVSLFGLRGRALALSSACATSSHAILFGLELVRHGLADRVLVGGGDSADIYLAAAFDAMRGALATNSNDEPTRASRPFAADRAGFVLASGAAVLVLESREGATARGARVRARLLGGAAGSDPGDAVLPTADGVAPADTIAAALTDAGLAPEEIGLVLAHATATPAGDRAEVAALRRVFGTYQPLITALKSRTGHALGGAGAIEACIAVLALEDQIAPATHNALPLDPEWSELRVVTTATPTPLRALVANAFGFGGALSSLVFGRELNV
jgi:3-oxoacyl-[acyl-carrier-protein] synthase-1